MFRSLGLLSLRVRVWHPTSVGNFTNFRSSTTELVEVHSNLLVKTPTKLREAPEQKGVLNDRLRQPERVRYEEKSTINLPRQIKGGENPCKFQCYPRAAEAEDRSF